METRQKLELVGIKEISEILNVHPETIRRWMKEEKIPFKRIGKKIYFNLETITKFFE